MSSNNQKIKFTKQISNFFFNKVFGKIALTCVMFWYGKYLVNKFRVKEEIADIEVNR